MWRDRERDRRGKKAREVRKGKSENVARERRERFELALYVKACEGDAAQVGARGEPDSA